MWLVNLEQRGHLEDTGVVGRIISKCTLKISNGRGQDSDKGK
jgi:hypothetical protein